MIGLYSRVLSTEGGKVGGPEFAEEMVAAIDIPALGPAVFRWRAEGLEGDVRDENVTLIKMCESEAEAIEVAVRYEIENEKW